MSAALPTHPGGTDVAAGLRLRRMRWWDVEAAAALERELFADDPWSAPALWSELAGVPESRHYVAAESADGRLAGYAGLMVAGGQADVQTVAVAPWAQGHRLGSRLLDALLVEAWRRDAGAVLLEVRADNDPAIRLYESRDFERLAVRRGYYQPSGADAVVMRLLRRDAATRGEARP